MFTGAWKGSRYRLNPIQQRIKRRIAMRLNHSNRVNTAFIAW